jgi:hypothetical protein
VSRRIAVAAEQRVTNEHEGATCTKKVTRMIITLIKLVDLSTGAN